MTFSDRLMDLHSERDYLPIADYGVIGNLRTTALVGRNGSIDWCCLPDLDSPSVFGGLLDRRIGGWFRIGPASGGLAEQHYVTDTAVLVTTFRTAGGVLEITDFMPVPTGLSVDRQQLGTAELHRVVRCVEGAVDVYLEWTPRPDFARAAPSVHSSEGGFVAVAGDFSVALALSREGAETATVQGGPAVTMQLHMTQGEVLAAVTAWGDAVPDASPERSIKACADAVREWRRWVESAQHGSDYAFAGEWRDLLVRSGITLKLLTFAPTGAIAAAATTSLPEQIGGVRNWDYRYTWIRDAAFTAQAFFALGHSAEAIGFIDFAERASAHATTDPLALQIMYGLRGETNLPETVLEHLEGYAGSAPVRIGNGAAVQLQHDIYGELLNAADELVHADGPLDPSTWEFLLAVADHACAIWKTPDFGIWEVRSEPRHFTYSKVMIWVALDCAIGLAEQLRLPAPVARWREHRDQVRRAVLEQGYDAELGSFVQSFGSKDLDASNLLIPMVEFLPFDDPRVQGTIDRTIEQLTQNGMVYRYLADDGLPGGEGTFGLATFWLVDVLAMSDRLDEARELFEGMMARANHLGLFAEQVDAATGSLLGNFPQAFTHVGMINSLVYLAHGSGLTLPFTAPLGSPLRKAARTQAAEPPGDGTTPPSRS